MKRQLQDLAVEIVLVCEFNESHGKQIIEAHPPIDQTSPINHQSFGLIAELILPRDQLCGRFLALEFKQQYFLIGLPTLIRNRQNQRTYFRSKYIYSVLMLVRKEKFLTDRDTYYQMMRKVSYFMAMLQQQKHILYYLNRECVKRLLETIYKGFNIKKECFLEYDNEHYAFISSKNTTKAEDICIKLEDVPVTCLSQIQIQHIDIPQIRAFMKQVLKGEDCVKKIALSLNRPISQIIEYLKIAITFGMVAMVDMFSLHNVYVLTPKVHEFAKNTKQLQLLKEFCFKKQKSKVDVHQLSLIVLLFNRSLTAGQIMRNHIKIFDKVISFVRLVRYCMLKGVIRRCHEVAFYPASSPPKRFLDKDIYLKYFKSVQQTQKIDTDNSLENSIRLKNEEFTQMVKNHAILDEICVAFMISRETAMQLFNQLGIVTVLCS